LYCHFLLFPCLYLVLLLRYLLHRMGSVAFLLFLFYEIEEQ
jgi:hypothetical protein